MSAGSAGSALPPSSQLARTMAPIVTTARMARALRLVRWGPRGPRESVPRTIGVFVVHARPPTSPQLHVGDEASGGGSRSGRRPWVVFEPKAKRGRRMTAKLRARSGHTSANSGVVRLVTAHLLSVFGEWAAVIAVLVYAYERGWRPGNGHRVGRDPDALVLGAPIAAALTDRYRALAVRQLGLGVQAAGFAARRQVRSRRRCRCSSSWQRR